MNGQSIKVLSYNVFSGQDEKFSKERLDLTINIILDQKPDIICLQEATTEFITKLNSHLSYYLYSKKESLNHEEIKIVESSGYMAILSKFEIKEKILIYKGGYCDDGILKVILKTHDTFGFDLHVYNVHLSGGTYDKPKEVILTKRIRRMIELDILNRDLKDKNQCIIAGDFNSDANCTELCIDAPYTLSDNTSSFPEVRFYPSRQFDDIRDAWHELKPDDLGFTEDTELNSFRKYLKKNQIRQARYDQIYYRYVGCIFAKKIQLVGIEAIGETDGVTLFPSDHFGIMCTFFINN